MKLPWFALLCFGCWNIVTAQSFRLVCYTKEAVNNFDLIKCTHIMYNGFTNFNENVTEEVKEIMSWKFKKHTLKFMISITMDDFKLNVNSVADTDHTVKYLKVNNFDGLDIQITNYDQYNSDKNMPNLIEAMGMKLKDEKLLFSVFTMIVNDNSDADYDADGSSDNEGYSEDYYDDSELRLLWNAKSSIITDLFLPISKSVDFFSGVFPIFDNTVQKADFTSLLYSNDSFSIDKIITELVGNNIPAEKINVGIALSGQSWKINSVINTSPPIVDGSVKPNGIMTYSEICNKIKTARWERTIVAGGKSYAISPELNKTKIWVSFDNINTVKAKTQYAKEKNLGGVTIFQLDQDDSHNICGEGAFPLATAAYKESSVDSPYISSFSLVLLVLINALNLFCF